MKAPYNFMAFNTFLGYIPIEISFHLPKWADRWSLLFWLMSLLWLLFYPNAPYVLTDLFHLSWLHPHTNISGILKSSPTIWLIFSIMIISAFICVLIGSLELLNTSSLIAKVIAPRFTQLRYLLMVIFTFCSSIGIYIGRFFKTPFYLYAHNAQLVFPSNYGSRFLVIIPICHYYDHPSTNNLLVCPLALSIKKLDF